MPDNKEILEAAAKRIRLAIPKEEFRVFVFGPGMEPGETVPIPASNISTQSGLVEYAKYLRYLTTKKLTEAGWTVDFGETQTIKQFWSTLGIRNSAAMEINHAKKLCGAIVIFPASIGAICELGLFAADLRLAEKTFAIVHSEYKEHNSFFRLGLLRLLKIGHGSFEFSD